MKILIALVVWVVAVFGAIEVSTVVADSIHTSPGSDGTGGSGGDGSGSGGGSPDPTTMTSTDSKSLFHTANLDRALASARAHLGAGARLTDAAIYPGYLSLIAAKQGTEVDFYVDAYGRIETSSGGSPGGEALFSLSHIKGNVPPALAQRIATAGHIPPTKLHYMVVDVDPISNKLEWLVYPVSGTSAMYFKASGARGPLFEYPTRGSSGLKQIAR